MLHQGQSQLMFDQSDSLGSETYYFVTLIGGGFSETELQSEIVNVQAFQVAQV